MSVRVGVAQGDYRGYSDAWRDQETFPEKELLRKVSRALGREDANFLSAIVEPGQNVVVKPNWVLDEHPCGLDIFGVITHSAVLRAVVDLAFEALRGEGSITIADAPQWNCDFANLMRVTEVERIAEYYQDRHNFEVPIRDLRLVGNVSEGFITSADRVALPGDPAGYAVVDLKQDSAFVGMPHSDRVYGADYDRSETRLHHRDDTHEYLISRTILGADTVISVPKLKVHKRVGVTVNAKGMVGINGHKNWIAHYRIGPPSAGGDEYPDGNPAAVRARARIMRIVLDHFLAPQSRPRERVFAMLRRGYKLARPVLGPLRFPDGDDGLPEGGNWHGNDTAWRMTADLARAVLFADQEGRIRDTPQRRFASVVDGIIGGDLEGPLAASARPCGVLVVGDSLLGVDLVCTRLMGFDWRKVRSLRWLTEASPQNMGVARPEDIEIVADPSSWRGLMRDASIDDLAFLPHPKWVGHLELDGRAPTETTVEYAQRSL
jgi:uncharacterized protein (DUF362 family)